MWATLIGLKLTKQHIEMDVFTGNGEFALYAAALITGSLYIVLKEVKNLADLKTTTFPSRNFLCVIMVVLLFVAATVFAFVCLLNLLGTAGKPDLLKLLDREFLRQITVAVVGIVIPLSVIVVVADNIRLEFDPQVIANDQMEALNEDFDNL